MEKSEFKIIFMDDEIFEENSVPKQAHERLVKNGFNVKALEKMSDVLSLYNKEFFNLYILDIDMSTIEDELNGKGTSVGEVLKMLSSLSNVVIFSARGVTDDMITAANYHFYRYVEKDNMYADGGIEALCQAAEELFTAPQTSKIEFNIEKPENNNVLFYYKENDYFSQKEIVTELEKKFDTVDTVSKLSEAITMKKEKDYTAIVLVSKEFPNRETIISQIKELNQGKEKLIIAVYSSASDDDKRYVIPLVNLNPFRILNLRQENKKETLNDYLDKAIMWYGRGEIFDFPEEDNKFYDVVKNSELSEEEIDSLIDDEDNLYDYETEDEDENNDEENE